MEKKLKNRIDKMKQRLQSADRRLNLALLSLKNQDLEQAIDYIKRAEMDLKILGFDSLGNF